MARVKTYEYMVEGLGWVPVDMLRYDAAWPASQESADEMARRIAHDPGDPPATRRPITLRSNRPPTVDRWRSFGWTVAGIRSY